MATHEFFVDMTCEGCSGAVTRVLKKIDVKFDIDLPNKKVFIQSDKDTDVLLETLKKTGKTEDHGQLCDHNLKKEVRDLTLGTS
ncbi:hypothetical protein NFI96_028360 [Prochilodus magdalenae]|nr:hypothetical protein NFI96_028360 [Prochilodus magdalenae]